MRERKKLLVNWSVQGPILIRLTIHVITFVAATTSLLCIFWMAQGGNLSDALGADVSSSSVFWFRFMPFAASCMVLLPLSIWDILRITNRLAGPLYRFEQVMSEFEKTGTLPEAILRDNDLLEHFCKRFNSFVAVMHERYPDCRPDRAPGRNAAHRPETRDGAERASSAMFAGSNDALEVSHS